MTNPGTTHPRLLGQVAMVTGGSRGLGAEISAALAAEGASVAVGCHTDVDAARKVTASLAGPGHHTVWQADVADDVACGLSVAETVEVHGRLDILVLNAGVWRGGRVDQLSTADWRLVIETTLGGAFNMTRAGVGYLKESGAGRIIVLSSVVGLAGNAGDAAYATAKAGLIGFSKSLAKELARDNITVNAIAPGFVETDMTNEVSERGRASLLDRALIKRPGRAEEVAAAVRYLVLEGSYITGHTLVIDGGVGL